MEKLRLYGFNNLTKTLSFNIYDVCYADTEEDKKGYIEYIDERYNSDRLTDILKDVTDMIGATVLNVAKQDYDPQGASVTMLIAEPPHVVGHLDKSHMTVHTYPESHPDQGVTTFRMDIEVSTCGEISPLSALNYLINAFDGDIIICDYRVRGFTRDMNGRKHFMDHRIESIQDYISEENLKLYKGIDTNFYQENVFHTKLIVRERPLDDYLFALDEKDLAPDLKKKIQDKLDCEMKEIFYGRNFEQHKY